MFHFADGWIWASTQDFWYFSHGIASPYWQLLYLRECWNMKIARKTRATWYESCCSLKAALTFHTDSELDANSSLRQNVGHFWFHAGRSRHRHQTSATGAGLQVKRYSGRQWCRGRGVSWPAILAMQGEFVGRGSCAQQPVWVLAGSHLLLVAALWALWTTSHGSQAGVIHAWRSVDVHHVYLELLWYFIMI